MKKLYIILSLIILLTAGFYTAKFFFTKDYIAVIGAMDAEIEEISKNLENKTTPKNNIFNITKGELGKYNIILAKSGIGKVNSAITTQYIIDKYRPKVIINSGLAGSLDSNLKRGDIIIAEKTVQHDFDLSAFGNVKGYMGTKANIDKPTEYYSDSKLIKGITKTIPEINPEIVFHIATIASGDIFLNNTEEKEKIKTEFNALAADMESAAIAQTAEKNNIPIIVIRTVSDSINENAKDYSDNKQNSAKISTNIIISLLKQNSLMYNK